VTYIHQQCQKFSQSGVPSPQELSSLIDFIDEHIFSTGKGLKPGKKSRRLTSLQQLQLVSLLHEYFSSETDFNLLCSVFMILFMVQGRDIEGKVQALARLLSLALSTNSISILNFGGVWVTQQAASSPHVLAVASHLVTHFICVQPKLDQNLLELPTQSPLFTVNLMTALGSLYYSSAECEVPPPSLVSLLAAWLEASPQGQGGQPQLPVQGSPHLTGLLPWSVLAPLSTPLSPEDCSPYPLLHLRLLESLATPDSPPVPPKALTSLAELLLARLSETGQSHLSSAATHLALDRFGQVVGAVLRSSSIPPHKDLLMLLNQLPSNRMLQLVMTHSK